MSEIQKVGPVVAHTSKAPDRATATSDTIREEASTTAQVMYFSSYEWILALGLHCVHSYAVPIHQHCDNRARWRRSYFFYHQTLYWSSQLSVCCQGKGQQQQQKHHIWSTFLLWILFLYHRKTCIWINCQEICSCWIWSKTSINSCNLLPNLIKDRLQSQVWTAATNLTINKQNLNKEQKNICCRDKYELLPSREPWPVWSNLIIDEQ